MACTRDKRKTAFGGFVLACLLFLVSAATLTKVNQFYGFYINDYDTGIYTNVVWNILTGDGFYSDILLRNHLGEHFSPIIILFAPLFLVAPSPIWLLAAQGLAVGTTYILIYFIALKIFGESNRPYPKALALLFAVWAFFYPPLMSALIFEFHPSTLGTPLVAGAILALLYGRNRLLWVLVGLLLLSKENAPLAILGLGLYAWLMLSRSQLAVALIATAGLSAALVMGVVMPFFRSGGWEHYDRLGPLVEWQKKMVYLYRLVKPLAFLPLASWRSLLCAGPLVALNLSVGYYPQYSGFLQYNDFGSVFFLLAAIHGADSLLGVLDSGLKPQKVTLLYALIAIAAVAAVGPQRYTVLTYVRLYWPGDAEQQLYREIAPYRSLPLNVGIATDGVLGPYLSARQRYIDLKKPENIALLRTGDLVLITSILPTRGQECAQTERLLAEEVKFVMIHKSAVLCVYQVTYATTDK